VGGRSTASIKLGGKEVAEGVKLKEKRGEKNCYKGDWAKKRLGTPNVPRKGSRRGGVMMFIPQQPRKNRKDITFLQDKRKSIWARGHEGSTGLHQRLWGERWKRHLVQKEGCRKEKKGRRVSRFA